MRTSSAVTAGHRGLEDNRIYRLALTGLFAALSYVVFTLLQIKIILPGGDAISIHPGDAIYVLGALILEGFCGELDGVLGTTIGDLFDPIYMVYVPRTFLLKLCTNLVTGLVARRVGRINESSDEKHVFRFAVATSICSLLFNVIFDPLVGYLYKLTILGKPATDLMLAWDIASISINAVASTAAAIAIYMPLRSTLIGSGFFDRFK